MSSIDPNSTPTNSIEGTLFELKPKKNYDALFSLISVQLNENKTDFSLEDFLESFSIQSEEIPLRVLTKLKTIIKGDVFLDTIYEKALILEGKKNLTQENLKEPSAIIEDKDLSTLQIETEVDEVITSLEVEEPLYIKEAQPPKPSVPKPSIKFEEDEEEVILRNQEDLNFLSDVEETKEEPSIVEIETTKIVVSEDSKEDFLADIFTNIDLDDIENSVTLKRSKRVDRLDSLVDSVNVRATESVTLLGSCYRANIAGLSLSDKSAIRNSMSSTKDLLAKTFKTIYNLIESTVPTKPNYESWLKMTSITDLESLYYGVLAATYRDTKQAIDVRCNNCKTLNTVHFLPNNLIEIKDESVFEEFTKILNSVNSFSDLAKHSILNKTAKLILNKSKAIVIIKIPTLFALLSEMNNSSLDESIKQLNLFIRDLYIPDIKQSKEAGKPVYYRLDNAESFNRFFQYLPPEDLEQIEKGTNSIGTKSSIIYKLPTHTCKKCSTIVPAIQLDIGNLVFTQVAGTSSS